MSILQRLLRDVQLPELYEVKRKFIDDSISDIEAALVATLEASGIASALPRGGEVAVVVGSRGIAALPVMVRGVVDWLGARGTHPFILPGMGSHGGATAQGQVEVLANLGITENTAGCPIRSSMDVVEVGRLACGLPVFMDALAARAGGVFVINRIKPHTAFSGPHESGLVKMLTIGLGNQRGAEACHALGYGEFATIMPEMARLMIGGANILGGLGTVENAFEKPCLVEAVPRDRFLERDAALLLRAKQQMPSLPVKQLDVLLVRRMGKEISGGGVDPNITGRPVTPFKSVDLAVGKMGVLCLTPASKGNATGLGTADVITRRLFESIDFEATYANVVTSTLLKAAFIPAIMPTEELAVRCLVKTCNAGDRAIRLAYIRDTLSMDRFLVSRAVAEELRSRSDCTVGDDPHSFVFGSNGDMVNPVWEQ